MDKRQPYESHEERRRYPRIALGTPATLIFGGQTLPARIHDLSPDGLQVRCDRKTLQAIHPSGKFIAPNDALMLDITFSLDVGGRRTELSAAIRMYYFVLLPEETELDVAFGGQFAEIHKSGQRLVDAFIAESMEPRKDN